MIWAAFAFLTAAALAVLVWPLLRRPPEGVSAQAAANVYRDQLAELERDRAAGRIGETEAEAARAEIARRLLAAEEAEPPPRRDSPLQARRLAVVLAFTLPALAVLLYLAHGRPGLPGLPFAERPAGPAASDVEAAARMSPEDRAAMIENMVASLAAKLEENPDDLEGWLRLARAYQVLERPAAAAEALARAVALQPDDVDLRMARVEALLAAADETAAFPPAVVEELDAVLARRPDHPLALFLRGEAARLTGDIAGARERWQRVLELLPEDAPQRETMRQQIEALGAD
jgi:cytochrome c-type biogenesis protein CcmH